MDDSLCRRNAGRIRRSQHLAELPRKIADLVNGNSRVQRGGHEGGLMNVRRPEKTPRRGQNYGQNQYNKAHSGEHRLGSFAPDASTHDGSVSPWIELKTGTTHSIPSIRKCGFIRAWAELDRFVSQVGF